jgi:ABC-2 type transport system permease protein
MSRGRAIWLVARRELVERGRSRAFLISMALAVAFILAGVFLPSLLGGGPEISRVGVVGTPPPTFATALDLQAGQSGLDIVSEAVPDAATAEAAVGDERLDLAIVFPPAEGVPSIVVREGRQGPLIQAVATAASTARTIEFLEGAGVDQGELGAASAPPDVRELQPAEPGQDTAFLFANVGVILLFISIFSFGTWVLTGVVEEKQSRVVEVVLSTVPARDLLIGKVAGIGVLGLVQLVAMVGAGLAAGTVTNRFTLPETTPAAVFQLLLWFVLGYAFYATALGVLGALASRMEEASNASAPVSILASLAYVFSLIVATSDPDGVPARVATFLPPVSPMVVPLRAALGAIEPWEVVLAIALTVAAIWVLFVVGGRVYSGAILATGGRIKLREAWRAANR